MIQRNRVAIIILFFLSFLLIIPSNSIHADKIRYAEQFYMLYVKNMSEVTNNILRNITYLKLALQAPFAPVVQSLYPAETQEEYIRYKYLFKMHVNFMLVRSYLQLGDRFYKEHIYYYNYLYKDAIYKSLLWAKFYYEIAYQYWDKVLKYQKLAQRFEKHRTKADKWEDEYYLIKAKQLNYKFIIERRLNDVENNIQYIKNWNNKLKINY